MSKSIGYVDMGVPNPGLLGMAGITSKLTTEIKYKESTFPGGEVFVRLTDPDASYDEVIIGLSATDSNQVMKLIMITDALRRQGVNVIHLYMPYVPYARQDRVCSPGESHSIRVFADLINSQKFNSVIVFDPHSDVTGALLNNVRIIDNHEFVRYAFVRMCELDNMFNIQDAVIVAPDAGATKKIHGLVADLRNTRHTRYFPDIKYVQAEKIRDMSTSNIVHTRINAHTSDVEGKVCVIVDDICDGGRTFLELAKALYDMGAKKVVLIVSHGIFSQGLSPFEQIIDIVVSGDSIKAPEHDKNTSNVIYLQLPIGI